MAGPMFGSLFGKDEDEDALPVGAPVQATVQQPMPVGIQDPKVRSYIGDLYGDKFSPSAREKLQSELNDSASGPNFMAGLAALGTGLQGGNAAASGMDFLKSQQDERNASLNQFDIGRKNLVDDKKLDMSLRDDAQNQDLLARERDPNSQESKSAQALAIKMGMKPELSSKLTAEQWKSLSPVTSKMYDIDQKSKDRREMMDDRNYARDQKSKERQDKLNDDLVLKMQTDLDPNKARGGNLAKNQSQVDQADRLKGLYTESNGDIRNLDARQMEELAIGMNKMLSGSSSPASSQVEALLPHSAVGNAQKMKEWLLNDPQGANQLEFVHRMAETVERERAISQDQVRKAQVQRLSAYDKLKNSDPERYKQITQAYGIDNSDIDEKGHYIPASQKAGASATVRMVGPDGKIRMIPKDQVAAAQKAGGKLADDMVAKADQ